MTVTLTYTSYSCIDGGASDLWLNIHVNINISTLDARKSTGYDDWRVGPQQWESILRSSGHDGWCVGPGVASGAQSKGVARGQTNALITLAPHSMAAHAFSCACYVEWREIRHPRHIAVRLLCGVAQVKSHAPYCCARQQYTATNRRPPTHTQEYTATNPPTHQHSAGVHCQ